ncbi:alpha/beta hydrolase [Hahella ganghwensis]|uniref:alpha/beta hydrolase n=1 Tax=Hahella ganghwensis TaxID=286420 RepID=UPI0003734B6F|nr:alpha/beta fold hydrolase [Hahella ganghwensis]
MLRYLENSFIFPGVPSDIPSYALYKPHEIWLQSDGAKLQGWKYDVAEPSGDRILLYFGGNAEDVTQMFSSAGLWGVQTVFTFNYRGYGNSTGSPSQDALYADALKIFDDLVSDYGVDGRNLVVLGRSLGSAVAIYLASQRSLERLVLVTPFDNLISVGKRHFPFLPVQSLLSQTFPSSKYADEIDVPVLMLIAGQDEIIPMDSSMALYNLWKGRKEVSLIERAGHNDLQLYETFDQEISRFLSGSIQTP